MAKKLNAWMAHVMRTKDANPGMQLKDVLRKAGQTYKKDASASSTKTHKKHGGVLPLLGSMFGGRKRRGGDDEKLFGQSDAPLAENAAQTSDAAQSSAAQSSAELTNANAEEVMAGGGKKSRRKRNKSSRKCKSKSKKSSRKSSRKRRAGFMID
jgi:hypothetical protein